MKKQLRRISRIAAIALVMLFLLSASVLATGEEGGDFGSSNIATGTQNLISDVSVWMIGLSLAVGSAAAIYCLIRRSMADEADGKMWMKRFITAILCAVGGALVGGIINLIASYF